MTTIEIVLGVALLLVIAAVIYFRRPNVATPEAIKDIEDRIRARIEGIEARAHQTALATPSPAQATPVTTVPSPQPVLPGYGPLPPPYAGPPRSQAEALAWFDSQPFFTQMQMPNPHIIPWFDAQGRKLDSQGNLIVDPVTVDVPIPPPKTPGDAEARRIFEQQTLTASQNYEASVRARATFDTEEQYATWLRGVYARRAG